MFSYPTIQNIIFLCEISVIHFICPSTTEIKLTALACLALKKATFPLDYPGHKVQESQRTYFKFSNIHFIKKS